MFTDKLGGKRFDRPEFLKMLDVARGGDLAVGSLGTHPQRVNRTISWLSERGIEQYN